MTKLYRPPLAQADIDELERIDWYVRGPWDAPSPLPPQEDHLNADWRDYPPARPEWHGTLAYAILCLCIGGLMMAAYAAGYRTTWGVWP